MSAIAEAIKLYGPDFPRVHGLYLEHGYCYSDPNALSLARPCIQSNYTLWVDPEEADAWWVELVVGLLGLAKLYSHIPFPLPKIGWAREFRGRPTPRFYNFNKLKTVINTF